MVKSISDSERYFFWGWIVYRDVFKDSPVHVTEWCRVATASGRAISESDKNKSHPVVHLDFCEEHNCADDQCKDYKQITDFVRK
jgi:hypothetical protein